MVHAVLFFPTYRSDCRVESSLSHVVSTRAACLPDSLPSAVPVTSLALGTSIRKTEMAAVILVPVPTGLIQNGDHIAR